MNEEAKDSEQKGGALAWPVIVTVLWCVVGLIALNGCFAPGYPYLTTEGMTPAPWENNHDEVMGGSVYRGNTNAAPAVAK